ncbi:MAG: rod shape-determining protein, partial [Lachnospiraceae bacterium]|nr:rod shape-determining protein [Lachnospiraceae bacterium]
MSNLGNFEEPIIYGLDIGTRSIVGTVGYQQKDRFVVVAQVSKAHETRAMIDGQIHDILAVGRTIAEVTRELEQKISHKLESVCIAAAGRVLKTVTTTAEHEFEEDKVVTEEDILALEALAVEHAYEEFHKENDTDMKFYCVGYSVMRYYMNHYPMGNLLDHKAKNISLELIATFLPDDVVDGLYRAVDHAGLTVANLTLEPIAAIEVAIPIMFRMLNIGLIDVGAGTSDICITKEGTIIAYGMLPIAGDGLTEIIARHCLVDFDTAEEVKIGIEKNEIVEYKDIMGLPKTIKREEVLEILAPQIDKMAEEAAGKLLELNGGKPVSAVFVVGGGGKIAGYTEKIAEKLGIPAERCAVRGEDVMQKVDFMERNIIKDSLLVTPIGICLNYYQKSNNFIFVTFNNRRVRLYDNNKLTVIDAAIQADFPNDGLFPKRGKALNITIDGRQRVIRGQSGEVAVITVNGSNADIHSPIRSNDVIEVAESTAGADASVQLDKLLEMDAQITVIVNDQRIEFPKLASVNGTIQTGFYEVQDGDQIEMLNFYTIRQITE